MMKLTVNIMLNSLRNKNICKGNITFKEYFVPLKKHIYGEKPDSDGFTVDFYKYFSGNIGLFVYRSLYFGYEIGSFSEFHYKGVISCIPNEGKDRR